VNAWLSKTKKDCECAFLVIKIFDKSKALYKTAIFLPYKSMIRLKNQYYFLNFLVLTNEFKFNALDFGLEYISAWILNYFLARTI